MTAIGKATAASLLKTASEIPNLEKDNENKFGKYSYVSIDDYYSKVASIANKNGLGWVCKEREYSFRKEENAVIFTYDFDLYSAAGDYIENFTTFTVVHPIQGAQSSGSAASYAEKMFMRTVFKVRTGELDADATDPNELKGGPKQRLSHVAEPPKAAPIKTVEPYKSTDGINVIEVPRDKDGQLMDNWVDIIVGTVKTFMSTPLSKKDIKVFKEANANLWDMVKEENPIAHTEIVTAITTAFKKAKE